MMSSGFLVDLMQTISDRGRRAIGQALSQFDGSQDIRTASGLIASCEALLSRRGEASGVALASLILSRYAALPEAERIVFLETLQTGFGPVEPDLTRAVAAYTAKPDQASLRKLQAAAEPRRQELIRRLNQAPGGTAQLVAMRRDMLSLAGKSTRWDDLDVDFVHLLGSWFNRGFLVMRRISWDTPARILEKIIRYEAVHAIRGWDDLRDRIEPEDRRLFAFFHPRLGDEPLIFVEVALCREVPSAIAPLLDHSRTVESASSATTAVFYSISNCQDGLKGISFGHFLIKQVAEDLRQELPGLTTFVTLSPVPGFAGWLGKSGDADDVELAATLAAGQWQASEALTLTLRPLVERAAARYFVQARRPDGRPVDPVARFHLGNGALLDHIRWPADRSAGALALSHGLMVNYRYDIARIEANHESYAESGTVNMSSSVRRLIARPAGSLLQRVTTG